VPTGITSKGRATRARIVTEAARLVRERGATNTGLDDIRAAAAVSSSQLFHYFPDGKRALMLAVAAYEADLILDEQQPELGALGDPPSWRSWAERLFERYRAQGQNCGLSALLSHLDRADPEVQQVVADLFRRWEAALAAGLRRLGRPEPDAAREAAVLLAAVQGGATILLATGSSEHLRIALDSAVDRILTDHP
jgi:AcrR family transcriptional regulator